MHILLNFVYLIYYGMDITITTRNFVFCNLSYATKKSHMQLFWSCMQHVQLHATFFSCIRQVAKDKISSSEYIFSCNYYKYVLLDYGLSLGLGHIN
jgi:hypothetical protein